MGSHYECDHGAHNTTDVCHGTRVHLLLTGDRGDSNYHARKTCKVH